MNHAVTRKAEGEREKKRVERKCLIAICRFKRTSVIIEATLVH
jgi:hypothetical protein